MERKGKFTLQQENQLEATTILQEKQIHLYPLPNKIAERRVLYTHFKCLQKCHRPSYSNHSARKEKSFMTKVQHPDHFCDFINKSATLSRAQDDSKPNLLNFINNIVPVSPKKAQQSGQKVQPYWQVHTEGVKSNCSVDSLLSLSRNRKNFSEIFLDRTKKKVKYQNQDKMKKKRLIRDILRNSKKSFTEGEKRKENEIDYSQSRSRKKDNKKEGPPYRPTIVRTEDLFPDKTKKNDKTKSAKNLSKKVLKVKAQTTQEKGQKSENIHLNVAIQEKGGSSPIHATNDPNPVKAQYIESPIKGNKSPSTSNSEATSHQQQHKHHHNEDLFSIYCNKNKEPKIEYINIEEDKEKDNAVLNDKILQLENRQKMLEERERKIRLEEELLERRLKEEQTLSKEFRKIFTIKRRDPSLLKESEQKAFKAKCKQLLINMKNRFPPKKKTLENNSLTTSQPKQLEKEPNPKKEPSIQPKITSQTMRQEAISRRLQQLQAMLKKHQQQLKKWCY